MNHLMKITSKDEKYEAQNTSYLSVLVDLKEIKPNQNSLNTLSSEQLVVYMTTTSTLLHIPLINIYNSLCDSSSLSNRQVQENI